MTYSYSAPPTDTGRDLFRGMDKKKPKNSKKEARPQIQVGEHGRYQIRSGLLSGAFVARAFPKTPTTKAASAARGVIAEASGATEEAAIAALHEAVDAREMQRVAARRRDAKTGQAVPGVEEYVEAIGQVGLTAPQCAMLTALSLAEAEGLSEAHMAKASGYKSRTTAKRSFSSAGQLIAAYLASGTLPSSTISGTEGVSLLGFQDDRGDGNEAGNWILHAELREAVRAAI